MPQLADKYGCTGCMACVDACSKQALTPSYNDEGHLTYKLDITLCVECGLCEKICPVVSGFQYGTNELKLSQPYAAWAENNVLRSKSTSGGVFAGLAKYIIGQGGVAVGASLLHNDVRHIAIEAEEDIIKLQGSKYTQSNTDGIYKVVKGLLLQGKTVLFSGMGCQVAGLLSYLGNKQYPGTLYSIDLICGGVPSRFLIDAYLKKNPQVDEIVAFRNKSSYEFSVKSEKGEVSVVPLSEKPFPLCGFYTELTNRYSCYDCSFNGAHRQSDITIGDYWGDKEYPEEHEKGLSIAVAHSVRGIDLLHKAELEVRETGWKDFLMNNSRMIDGYNSASRKKARRNLANAFAEYSYEKLLQVYANKATWHEPLLMIKKILKYLTGKICGCLYRINLKKKIRKLEEQ